MNSDIRVPSMPTHGGGHEGEDFGGIPIVILVGDDFQLPPPSNKDKGAFDTMSSQPSISQQKFSVASRGAQLFHDLSETCVALTTIKRQTSDQGAFKDILQRLRTGDATIEDADTLMDLHLSRCSSREVNEIMGKGVVMNLFAKKASKNEFNYRKLSEVSNENNPVALLKAQWTNKGNMKTAIKGHFKHPPPTATVLCRNAVVCIAEKNFKPEFGLFNNAVGTVQEIIFEEGKNPNAGDLPLYIAVEFPQYCGPPWDPDNEKVVPIPMVTRPCDKKCCTVTYCPLALSFAKTSHTFQGQSAGPVGQGQLLNAVDKVVVDPGEKAFEGINPGLLYMSTSRATTIGTGNLDSAIYFSGSNMTRHHILNLKLAKTGDEYKKVQLRSKWVKRVENNTVHYEYSQEEINSIIEWCQTCQVTKDELEYAISRRDWRKNTIKDINYVKKNIIATLKNKSMKREKTRLLCTYIYMCEYNT